MKRRQVIKAICQATVGVATATVAGTALARVGRPLTPGSVAGVRRRTRRRTRRRMYYMTAGMTIYGLPYGCSYMRPYGGINMYYCSGIYYRPVHQGTTVVYVVEKVEPGANTQVEIDEYY